MESVVINDTVRHFFHSIAPLLGFEWMRRNAAVIWRVLPSLVVLDWDSMEEPKYRHQDGAAFGYNLCKPSLRSFHPLLAVVA
jgi:hypothetical protein